MKLTERQFPVEIECDEGMLTRPFYIGSFGHAAKFSELSVSSKIHYLRRS